MAGEFASLDDPCPKVIESNINIYTSKSIQSEQAPPSFPFDVREGGPALAGETVGVLYTFIKEILEIAGFNATPAKIREATPAARKALKYKIQKEDIIKAAKAIKMVKEGKLGSGLTPSVRSPFQRPDFWASQAEDKKPKKGMIIT